MTKTAAVECGNRRFWTGLCNMGYYEMNLLNQVKSKNAFSYKFCMHSNFDSEIKKYVEFF